MRQETMKEVEEKIVWWKQKKLGWGIWAPVKPKRPKENGSENGSKAKKARKTKEYIRAFHERRQLARQWRKLRNLDKIARMKKVEVKLNTP